MIRLLVALAFVHAALLSMRIARTHVQRAEGPERHALRRVQLAQRRVRGAHRLVQRAR